MLVVALIIGAGALLFGARQDAGAVRPPGALRVTVIDGDSLRADAENIRLASIDAPELAQTCRDAELREWACGRAAKERLAVLASGSDVFCRPQGRDRYGRTLAICSAGAVPDLGEALVREGFAVDYGRAGSGYGAAEREARAARRGVWRGDFERPQDWRRRHPRTG